jgi:hypothetical protein
MASTGDTNKTIQRIQYNSVIMNSEQQQQLQRMYQMNSQYFSSPSHMMNHIHCSKVCLNLDIDKIVLATPTMNSTTTVRQQQQLQLQQQTTTESQYIIHHPILKQSISQQIVTIQSSDTKLQSKINKKKKKMKQQQPQAKPKFSHNIKRVNSFVLQKLEANQTNVTKLRFYTYVPTDFR